MPFSLFSSLSAFLITGTLFCDNNRRGQLLQTYMEFTSISFHFSNQVSFYNNYRSWKRKWKLNTFNSNKVWSAQYRAGLCRNVSLHTQCLTALFLGLPRWAGTRKVKPIWISLKQETVSGSGISWAICKSAPRSRQITTPAPQHSLFLQAGCPSCRPTYSVKALKALKRKLKYGRVVTASVVTVNILPVPVLELGRERS